MFINGKKSKQVFYLEPQQDMLCVFKEAKRYKINHYYPPDDLFKWGLVSVNIGHRISVALDVPFNSGLSYKHYKVYDESGNEIFNIK